MCGILGFLSNKGFIAQNLQKEKAGLYDTSTQQWMKNELYHFCQKYLSNISDLDPSDELVIDKMWKLIKITLTWGLLLNEFLKNNSSFVKMVQNNQIKF